VNALINVLLSSTFIAGVTVAVINALSNRKINFTQYFLKEYMMWILLVVEMPAGIAGIIQCIKDMSNYKQKKVLYVIALLGLVASGVYEMNSLIAYYGGIGMIEEFEMNTVSFLA